MVEVMAALEGYTIVCMLTIALGLGMFGHVAVRERKIPTLGIVLVTYVYGAAYYTLASTVLRRDTMFLGILFTVLAAHTMAIAIDADLEQVGMATILAYVLATHLYLVSWLMVLNAGPVAKEFSAVGMAMMVLIGWMTRAIAARAGRTSLAAGPACIGLLLVEEIWRTVGVTLAHMVGVGIMGFAVVGIAMVYSCVIGRSRVHLAITMVE